MPLKRFKEARYAHARVATEMEHKLLLRWPNCRPITIRLPLDDILIAQVLEESDQLADTVQRAAEMRQGVYVCAKEGVRAGDEMLISYGKPFWRARVDGSLEDFVTQRPAQPPSSAEPEAP